MKHDLAYKITHERYTNPTHLDHASFGTLWVNINDEKNPLYYVQVNEWEDKPKWMRVGDILEEVLKDFYSTPSFISELLELYLSAQEGHAEYKFVKLNKLMSSVK